METIIYQGREIQAEMLHDFGGSDMGERQGRPRAGADELWRDAAGNYYARQVRYDEGEGARDPERDHYWESTHRISQRAAVLWAVSVCGQSDRGLPLRADAAALLKHSTPAGASPRAMVANPASFAEQSVQVVSQGRITVELDDLASAMLRKTRKEGDPCRHAGEDLRDLVNAAVTFYLCDDRNEEHGEFDLSCGDQALERARRDRLRLEAAKPESRPAPVDHVDEPEAVETQPGVHRFTFDYPATETRSGLQRTVELTDEQMQRARELAATFGMELTAFLRGLVGRNDLPGQRCYSDAKVYNLLQGEHIGFVCTDAAMARRIERAAQSRGESVEEHVAHALGGYVDTWEECMLLHPTTGDLLDTDYEELYTEVKCEYMLAPLGQEDERPWKLSIGKERVNFGVFLRPDQLEKVEYPHMVWDDDENRNVPCVLIPLDPEGNPVLRVGSRYVEPGKAIPRAQAASQTTTGFADLDNNSRELLAKHLAENPELDARDVLNGAVTFLLSDGVDWNDDAVNEARSRRLAREDTDKHHVALCVLLDDEAAALVRRYLEVTAWNFAAADIVSGCVVHALEIAFENQKEAEEMSGLANPQEHDGAWGYVETRISDAACRRTGSEGTELKNPDDERTTGTERVIIEIVASDLSGEELDALDREAYRREHAKPNPADVALLAASAPEADEPASPAEGDEHLPVEEHVDEHEDGAATPDGEEGK